MHGDVDAEILWLRLIAKYLVNECNLKRSNANSCILFKKDDKGKLELMMSAHVDDVFVDVNTKTLKKTQIKY